METSLFILALSKTLPESCLQGIIVYLVLQLLLAIFKKSTSGFRFNLFYAASVLLFAGFVFNLFQHYSQVRASAFADTLISNPSPNFAITSTTKISWWQQLTFYTNHYAYTITGLYLIGLIFCVLRLALGLININWFKRDRHLQQQDIWTEKIKLLSTHFNLLKTVSIFLSDKIQVPLTIGFFKPIIVFPIALINHLSIQQTEAILLHELAHIKRSDYLLNIVLSIIQSFLFFNPIIWLLSREINKYREQCCDDLVMNKTNDCIAYAKALLQIEQFRSSQLTLALASNGKKYTLLNRIKRITTMEINNSSPQNKLLVLLLALTTIGLSVAWNVPVKKEIKERVIQKLNLTKTNLNKTIVSWSANRVTLTPAQPDTSGLKITSDKMVLRPDNKPDKKLIITGNQMVFDLDADTVIKSKNKFKIVLEDSTGNKKEYNSIEELPADEQKEFLKQNKEFDNKFNDVTFSYKHPDSVKYSYHSKFYDLQDLKRQAEEIKKMEEKRERSPEFKKQMAKMRKQTKELSKKFNSPEWKKQQEEIRKQFDSPEYKKKMEDMVKQFNSPEYKKKMEDMVKQFNSPEYKKKMEDMVKYYQSPQWKKYEKEILKNYNGFDTVAAPQKEKLD